MNKSGRVTYVLNRLEELYPVVKPPLTHKDPYTLLIAVLLSARCTDERVNQVTPRLFKLADTPQQMAKVQVEDIQEIIRPCGLSPQKAKAISGLSKILIEKHGGNVPKTLLELEALPGVGHKTASVVIVQAFNEPAFPVDTHIHRVAQRWGFSQGQSVKQTEEDLKKLFPKEKWGKLHLQMIYYAREHCSAWGCDGTVCEICRKCYPNRKKPLVHNKQ